MKSVFQSFLFSVLLHIGIMVIMYGKLEAHEFLNEGNVTIVYKFEYPPSASSPYLIITVFLVMLAFLAVKRFIKKRWGD